MLPPPLLGGPPSDVPVAVQMLRWQMLASDVSALMFRSMDSLFTTRTVARGGPVWTLPRSDRPLDFSYRWQGQSLPADAFLERTYTNALLVMKDGRIVSEIYRNNSNERSRFIGWSMTKSVTSILVGCALAEGRIDSLDTPISDYLPELKGGGYDGVSIRHVMQMRSGRRLRGALRLRESRPRREQSHFLAGAQRHAFHRRRAHAAARSTRRENSSSTRRSTHRCSAG